MVRLWEEMDSVTIGQLITFLTVLLGFLLQYVREGRQRKWDLEDRRLARELVREETRATAQDLKNATVETAKKLAEETAETFNSHSTKLAGMIEANTEISKSAFHEANSVNVKIQDNQEVIKANQEAIQKITASMK